MEAFVAAGAGFLLAVLWFDLMFDVQARGHRDRELPEAVLASIAAYYRRVTTTARPMNRLVAVAMVGTVAAIIVEVVDDDVEAWIGWTSLVLVVTAIAIAALRTVPRAVQLGTRPGTNDEQSRAARAILRDHAVCFALILTVLALQLSSAAT